MAEWIVAVFVLLAVVVGSAFALRAARLRGALSTRQGRCELCGVRAPVFEGKYHQNTGLLLMRRHRVYAATACRKCHTPLFLRATVHTAVLGWWGMISALVTPLFLLNNLGTFYWAQTLPSASHLARSALDEHRDYALNLLATKDPAIVVEVLVKQTGASPAEVQSFLDQLRRAA